MTIWKGSYTEVYVIVENGVGMFDVNVERHNKEYIVNNRTWCDKDYQKWINENKK